MAPARGRDATVMEAGAAAAGAAAATPRGAWWPRALLLIVLASVPFLPALSGGLIFDDQPFFVNGPEVIAPDGLYRIWLTNQPLDYWPVTYTAFWVEYRLFGNWAAGYRLANIALHVACCLLIWRLLERLKIPAPWLCAALFAAHPVNVGTVVFISQQKTLLAALFGFASVWYYRDYRERGGRWALAACVGLFTLALLSKTTAIAFLPTYVLATIWRERKLSRRDLLALIPLGVAALICTALAVVFKSHAEQDVAPVDTTLIASILTSARAFWFYAQKAVFPAPLYFFYPTFETTGESVGEYLPLAALVASAVLLIAAARRWRWALGAALAVAFFGVHLAPSIYFKAYTRFWMFHVADYYQYPALLGVLILIAAGLAQLCRRRAALGRLAIGTVGMVLVMLSLQQSSIYQEEEYLWQHSLVGNPRCGSARYMLADYYKRLGRVEEAIEQYTLALEDGLFPEHLYLTARGFLYYELRLYDEALRDLDALLETQTVDPPSLNQRGNINRLKGDSAAAIADFTRALAMDPNNYPALFERAEVYKGLGQYRAALEDVERGLRIEPEPAMEALRDELARQIDGEAP